MQTMTKKQRSILLSISMDKRKSLLTRLAALKKRMESMKKVLDFS